MAAVGTVVKSAGVIAAAYKIPIAAMVETAGAIGAVSGASLASKGSEAGDNPFGKADITLVAVVCPFGRFS